MLYDSGDGPQRFLLFGTQMNIEMLNASQIWLCDGTFKTAPKLFAQVYCIHGLRGGPSLLEDGHLLPSIFVLLPNKTEVLYTRIWEQIKILCPDAMPTNMIMDFEIAAINIDSCQHLLSLHHLMFRNYEVTKSVQIMIVRKYTDHDLCTFCYMGIIPSSIAF